MILKIFLCLVALVNTSASNDYSGLLSRLFKKANNENRPLILVLDNSLEDLDETRSVNTKEADKNAPSNLLDFFLPKQQSLKFEHRHKLYDNPLEQQENQPRYQQSDLQNLAYRLKKERREQREKKYRKERKYRAQYREDELDNDDERQERYEVRKPDRYQDRNQNRYQDRNQYNNQDRYQDRNQDRHQNRSEYRYNDRDQNRNQDKYHYKSQDRYQDRGQYKNQELSQDKKSGKRGLKSSVIKNLLRTYNDINCEAKAECTDECGNKFQGKKKNNCQQKCEIKYDCDQEEDPCEDDECADSEEPTGSTRGERLITVTEKCKRC